MPALLNVDAEAVEQFTSERTVVVPWSMNLSGLGVTGVEH
jgi:hypothetical protein